MNSHKARCQWCRKMYVSAGAYTSHIQKSHPERLQAATISLKHRQSDTTYKPNDASMEYSLDKYSANSDLYNYDLNRLELAQICHAYPHFEPAPEISEAEYDSDVEPFVETTSLLSSNESNGSASTPDAIHSPPNLYKVVQPVRDFLFSQQRSKGYNHLHPFHNPRDYNISKKNKRGFVGHRVTSWHRCLLVSLRCLSSVYWCLLVSSGLAVFLLETVLEK